MLAHLFKWGMEKITFATTFRIVVCLLVLNLSSTSQAGTGFLQNPVKAPAWAIEEWVVGSETSLEQLKGKVVVIDFFQLWCPGCNSFSIPLVAKWGKKYSKQQESGKIVFISIHTVFEGHSYQNNERLKKFVKEKGMKHRVGVDARKKGARVPITMDRYNTYGTPEIAIVDTKGFIRFQKFGGFDHKPVERLIDRLLE